MSIFFSGISNLIPPTQIAIQNGVALRAETISASAISLSSINCYGF
jgi:hypothetical protein